MEHSTLAKKIWLLPAVSQIVSSISNFLIPYAALRALEIDEFGVLSLAYAAIHIGVQIVRCGFSEPLLLHRRAHGGTANGARSLLIASFAVSALIAGLLATAAIVATADWKLSLVIGAACIAVSMSESTKYGLLYQNKRGESFAIDCAWLALELASLGVLFWLGWISTYSLLIVWGASGLVSSAYCIGRVFLHQRQSTWSLHFFSPHGVRLASDVLIQYAGPYGVVLLLGTFGGLVQVGVYQTAILLYRPLQLLLSGAGVALLSATGRQGSVVADLTKLAAMTFLATLAITTGLLFAPEAVGIALIGQNWSIAQAAWQVGAANTFGWVIGQIMILRLKLDAYSGELLLIKITTTSLMLFIAAKLPVDTALEAALLVGAAGILSAVMSLWRYRSRTSQKALER